MNNANNEKLVGFIPSILEEMRPSGYFHGWALNDVVDYVLEGHDDLGTEDAPELLRLLEENC